MADQPSRPPGFPPAPGKPASPDLHDDRTDPGIQIQRPKPTPTPNPAAAKLPPLGVLDPLMADPTITEVMINDLRNIMVEREGRLVQANVNLGGLDELNRLVRAILDVTGRVLSPDSPYVDVMLPDGSRVNIVGNPITLAGPCITIRKFPQYTLTPEDLVRGGVMDGRMAQFLQACVAARTNIIVSGGTGSGKTTLLNALASFIPRGERIVTIEDVPELRFPHTNSVRMQTKPQLPTSPPVTARDLLSNSLRMRPDRILVGECRKGEALDMLQAMNTGHSGSMTTLHANSPRDALTRLETLCLMAGIDLPISAIRRQAASAVDLLIQIQRFRNGKRKIIAISEVTGMEGETILLQDIFSYEMEAGEGGRFICTGFVPTLLERLRENGIELSRTFFA